MLTRHITRNFAIVPSIGLVVPRDRAPGVPWWDAGAGGCCEIESKESQVSLLAKVLAYRITWLGEYAKHDGDGNPDAARMDVLKLT